MEHTARVGSRGEGCLAAGRVPLFPGSSRRGAASGCVRPAAGGQAAACLAPTWTGRAPPPAPPAARPWPPCSAPGRWGPARPPRPACAQCGPRAPAPCAARSRSARCPAGWWGGEVRGLPAGGAAAWSGSFLQAGGSTCASILGALEQEGRLALLVSYTTRLTFSTSTPSIPALALVKTVS